MSPIFVLHSGRRLERCSPRRSPAEPFCEVDRPRRHRPPRLADRRSGGPRRPSPQSLAGSELLIADGHHRYETARTYADEVGAGAGDDAATRSPASSRSRIPGLSVFATHRLLHDLDDGEAGRAPRHAVRAVRARADRRSRRASSRPTTTATIAFGYMDSFHRKPYRLRLKDDAVLDAALPGSSRGLPDPRRRRARGADPDAAPLGMSTDDIAAKRGLSYCSDFGEAVPGSSAARPTRVLPPPDARSSRCATSPTPARRCRRSRPTSSRSS